MICPSCQAQNIEGADDCADCGKPLYGLDFRDATREEGPQFINEPISTVLDGKKLVKASPSDPVALAVRLMQNDGTSSVLVMEGEKIAGILTSMDILHKVAGPNEDLNAVTCGQIMTPDPMCLEESDSIAVALNIMSAGGFRHIPVLRESKPVTVIGVSDVFRFISPHLI